jgi:hypothetical protein
VGPIAFVLVFLLVPLAAAVLAGAFFAAVGIANLLAAVPTGLWAVLTVGAGVAVAARLWVVLRTLRPGQTRRGVGAPRHCGGMPGGQGPAARNMP